MFGTTHALTGIVLSQTTSDLPAVFGLSFLSHIVLDFIPHGDNLIVLGKNSKEKRVPFDLSFSQAAFRKLIPYAIVDGIILIGALIYLLFVIRLDPTKTIVAVIGALFIDGIAFLYKITKWSFFRKLEKYHHKIHQVITRYLPNGDVSPVISISLQIAFAVVVLWTLSI